MDFSKPIIIEYSKPPGKQIGIAVGTHGDEVVGLEVLNRIRTTVSNSLKSGTVKFIIVNPLAVAFGVRYIYKNLNTEAFPGNPSGDFEDKLAYNISLELKSLDYLIDIHSTNGRIEPYIIARNKQVGLIEKIPLEKIVLFEKNELKENVLIDYAKEGVAIEIGPHKSERNFVKISRAILQTLINLKFIEGQEQLTKKTFYKYIGDFGGIETLSNSVQNFKTLKKR